MKKSIIILYLFFTYFTSESQTLEHLNSIKSPDLSSFQQANFVPVNEYTGRINIEIPIYNIDLDGLSIPISVSYNTGGVKVNSTSSSVGLNWSLNAGGFISREIKGDDDFVGELEYGGSYTGSLNISAGDGSTETFSTAFTSALYIRFGYLAHNNYDSGFQTLPSRKDKEPDTYSLYAPGLTTQFTNKSNMEIVELSPTGSKFAPDVQNSSARTLFTYTGFKVTSSQGYVYTFNEREVSSNTFSNYQGDRNLHEKITPGFCCPSGSGKNYNRLSSLKLSSIKHPTTGRTIEFEYENNLIKDSEIRIDRDFNTDGSFHQQYDQYSDSVLEKVIKKIIFNEGIIDFSYSDARTDLIGAKRLIKIEVKDIHNKIIKTVHFKQDYFTSVDDCNDPKCYRLRLKEIYFTDVNNNKLPGYQFLYNTKKLPKRYSYNQDFLGYANSASVSGTYLYVPKIFFKENQGRNTYLPFNIPSKGYTQLTGNYSLNSDVNFSKAATLEKIVYPTKGYATFDYELNSFMFLGEEINGGGLRIKTYKLHDYDNTIKKQKTYLYEEENGETSGNILFVPRYITKSKYNKISQRSNNDLQLTGGSYVGYSRVKIIDNNGTTNNGYTINKYTSPKDFPNNFPTSYSLVNTNEFTNLSLVTEPYDKGLYPNIYQNNEIKRGLLVSSNIFNSQDLLKKEISNTYTHKEFDTILTYEPLILSSSIGEMEDMIYEPHAIINSKIVSERNLLLKKVEKDHLENGILINETNFVYDDNLPLVKETENTVNNKVTKTKYFYPNDVNSISSLGHDNLLPNEFQGINKLKEQNTLSNPVQIEKFNNHNLISSKRTNYFEPYTNKTVPKSVEISKGDNDFYEDIVFHNYYPSGKLKEASKKDGTKIYFIWGYQESQLIAKIEGYTDSQLNAIQSKITTAISASNSDSSLITEDTLRVALNDIRNDSNMISSQVITYTYNPLIGITSITDPRGEVTYYIYDDFNRLKYIKDANSNILKEYQYNLILPKDLDAEECASYKLTVTGTRDDDTFSYSYTKCDGRIESVNKYVGDVGFGTVYNVCIKKGTGGINTTGYIMTKFIQSGCEDKNPSSTGSLTTTISHQTGTDDAVIFKAIAFGGTNSGYSFQWLNDSGEVIGTGETYTTNVVCESSFGVNVKVIDSASNEAIDTYTYTASNCSQNSECETYKLTVTGTRDDDTFSYSYTNCNGINVSVNKYVGDVSFGRVYNVCVKKNTGGVKTSGYIFSKNTGNFCE